MRIALLSNWNSTFTRTWADALSARGHEVSVITKECHHPCSDDISVIKLPLKSYIGYYANLPFLRNILLRLKPDLLHAHYASGFGTLGRISRWHPYVLSVWGSDVYEFPERSAFHMRLMQKNLLAADWICSTSHAMSRRVRQLVPSIENLATTPFGIDTIKFVPSSQTTNDSIIRIGAVKRLAPDAGIDILIRAFKTVLDLLKQKSPSLVGQLRLLIAGDGNERDELISLTKQYELTPHVKFVGEVPHDLIPNYLQELDIYCALSRVESFGVAALEASACGLPVVASRVPGLEETQIDGRTALFVAKEDPVGAAQMIVNLILDRNLRNRLGKAGRDNVVLNYDWNKSVDIMESIYSKVVKTPM